MPPDLVLRILSIAFYHKEKRGLIDLKSHQINSATVYNSWFIIYIVTG